MSKYKSDYDATMYNRRLTKAAFKKLIANGRYWCTKREKTFLREMWDLYVLYSLPSKSYHEEDIRLEKKMRKACKQIFESYLHCTELDVYYKIHEASKGKNINDVLEAYLNDSL